MTAQFDGRDLPAFDGDTVAAAIVASGQWVVSRSFKYHRPRGPLTFAGHDVNTLVQTPAAPNRLADELPVRDFTDDHGTKRFRDPHGRSQCDH